MNLREKKILFYILNGCLNLRPAMGITNVFFENLGGIRDIANLALVIGPVTKPENVIRSSVSGSFRYEDLNGG